MKSKHIIGIIFSAVIFYSCEHHWLDVDVSKVNIKEVKIERTEKEIFGIDKNHIKEESHQLLAKYGSLYESFMQNIIAPPLGIKDTMFEQKLINFITDNDMLSAYNDCEKTFQDLSELEKKLTLSFQYFHYHFPEKRLPKVISAMSGFNYSIIKADTFLTVCLEMYLGSKNKFYDMLQYPAYKRNNMNPENLYPDLIRGWMLDEFPKPAGKDDLLSEMIYQGQILYLLDAMMPDEGDTTKIGFTKKQLDWCERNNENIWGFLIKNKLLYSTESEIVAKFTNEGPFTSGFAKESPARTGNWLGWKIVRKYMNDNPEISLRQLMEEKDASLILSKSKYKPK